MARIRSIKPEFWSSPGMEDLDPFARLLYIAMWNWADDNGVGVANPRELLGFAFPLDDQITVADIRRWLEDIRRVYGVTFYEVARRPYFAIPSWEKHQKFDRRSKGKYPGPDEGEPLTKPLIPVVSTESHEPPPSVPRDSVAGTGEQGNRGTVKKSVQPTVEPEFERFWNLYPRKQGKQAALKAFVKARKTTDLEVIMAGLNRYVLMTVTAEKQFVKMAAPWLNDARWDDELVASSSSPSAYVKSDECHLHPGYVLPCARCDREAGENPF